MMSQLIALFVAVIIAFSVYGQITEAVEQSNVPGSAQKVLELLPAGFTLMVLLMVVGMIWSMLRGAEEPSEDYRGDYEKKDPDHKQTYKEYVEEQLEVERMMK